MSQAYGLGVYTWTRDQMDTVGGAERSGRGRSGSRGGLFERGDGFREGSGMGCERGGVLS